MKDAANRIFDDLIARFGALAENREAIERAFAILFDAARTEARIFTCGNGGSAADAEHLAGELLKSFRKARAINPALAAKLPKELAERLEGSIAAIPLVSMTGALTAIANDVGYDVAFAQELYGLARPGDVLVAFSTSGNSANCVAAALVARAKGLKVIAFTGAGGGELARAADVVIAVPERETYKVQELHLPVYHALAAALEAACF